MSSSGRTVAPREWWKEEAVVLVKAAPLPSTRYKETVCCAALTDRGEWLRLYPIRYRLLPSEKRFRRWDRIQFCARRPPPHKDNRPESRRVDERSIRILGQIRAEQRGAFVAPAVVDSLKAEEEKGRSFALLRVEVIKFFIERLDNETFKEKQQRFLDATRQRDLLESEELVPYRPCPFKFRYRYRCIDGEREGTCQDWETEATFFKWKKRYGERDALYRMQERFGHQYRQKGVLFAMGTHARFPGTWLINGVIRVDVPAHVQTRMNF